MSKITDFFSIFDYLPKIIIENIRCFFVTEKYLYKTGYCITNEDKVYAIGQHINEIFGFIENNDNTNYALIPELCDKQIEEFFDGYNRMFARNQSNQIFIWGKQGYLFDENDLNKRPKKFDYFDHKNIMDISDGFKHCLALSSEGVIYGLGDNTFGQLGIFTDIKWAKIPVIIHLTNDLRNQMQSIYCEFNQSFIIKRSGVIYEFKRNKMKLCKGPTQRIKNFKKDIKDIEASKHRFYCQNKDIQFKFTCSSLTFWTNQAVYKVDYESGILSEKNYHNPFEFFLFESQITYKTIHLRDNELFVIKYVKNHENSFKTNEIIYDDIENFYQRFGQTLKLKEFRVFDDLLKNIESNVKCYHISGEWDSFYSSAIFVMTDNYVFGFGYNYCGKLGFGHNNRVEYYEDIPKLCGQNIEEFFEMNECMFARNDKNQIFGWGRNKYGLLGQGYESSNYLKPQKIDKLDDKNIVEISCGNNHCLALSSNGLVYGWGRNNKGQNGYENRVSFTSVPIEVKLLLPIKFIMCSGFTSFLIDIEGKIKFMGELNPENEEIRKLNIRKIVRSYRLYIILCKNGWIYEFDIQGNTIKQIESKVNFIDILGKKEIIILQSEDCVYELNSEDTLGESNLEKTDYLNFYDYFIHKYNFLFKTIHITSDGFLITKDIKFNENYDKTVEQNVLLIENKNVFDRKFETLFENSSKIGCGAYSEVFQATEIRSGSLFAIKRIKIEGDLSSILKEVKILSGLNSSFVVQYKNAWIEAKVIDKELVNYAYIQMQFCTNNLREVIETMDRISDERFNLIKYYISCELFRELTECVNYLHSLTPPIIHRDLKPENVLISDGSDRRFLKLCDFGLAKVHLKSLHTRDQGTLKYMAFEVRYSEHYNLKADIYSLAVIAKEIFGLKNSIDEIRKMENIYNNLNIEFKLFITLLETLSQCLVKVYELRPNCMDLLDRMNEWSFDSENIQKILDDSEKEFLKIFFETKVDKTNHGFSNKHS